MELKHLQWLNCGFSLLGCQKGFIESSFTSCMGLVVECHVNADLMDTVTGPTRSKTVCIRHFVEQRP